MGGLEAFDSDIKLMFLHGIAPGLIGRMAFSTGLILREETCRREKGQ
jgi:hypothetical protein